MFDRETLVLAEQVLEAFRSRGLMLATAESCTGGLVIAALTEIPGSSDVVVAGYVTYGNDAKRSMLGVNRETLERHGAVSRETAREMAEGALSRSSADVAVAITGVAGPGGGSRDKPVGLVHFAVAARAGAMRDEEQRFGELPRHEIRDRSVRLALAMLRGAAQALPGL